MATRLAHALLVLLAGLPWVCGYFAFALSAVLVTWADRLWPDANYGNCWSFAGPKWLRGGGYLAIRTVPSARFLKVFPVIHAVWMRQMPKEAEIEMTKPIRRQRAQWLPWRTFYFQFRVARRDRAQTTHEGAE